MSRTSAALSACVMIVLGSYLTGLAHPDPGTILIQLFAWIGGGLFYRLALEAHETRA